MTLKQRERIVKRAVKALDKAVEALDDLDDMASEITPDVDMSRERQFRREMRERSEYWESCSWWRNR